MSIAWQEFVQSQISSSKNAGGAYFHHPLTELQSTRDGLVMCNLSQCGTLRVGGADAQVFLQNMLSSDVREVSAQRAQISSLNNPKGRMLACLLIWRRHDDYFLCVPPSLCPSILQRLSMYVLRAKVKIENVSAQQISIGLSGPGSEELLQHTFGSVPKPVMWAQEQYDHASVIRCDAQRFQIVTNEHYAPTLWKKISISARPVSSICWDWLNIRGGIPTIFSNTQDQFVPQMVNLEMIGGVSFNKGCYPGQEIVARMQHLGKLKRRMFLAHLDKEQIKPEAIPQPGDTLYSADMADQACGMVVNAAPEPNGGCDLLAVVQNSSRETQTVHLHSPDGPTLLFMNLPYFPASPATEFTHSNLEN